MDQKKIISIKEEESNEGSAIVGSMDTGIVIVKEEFNLEFEELEFDNCRPEEFADKVIQLFALQNVPADANDSKISLSQCDQELSQIVIKEEIDCDVDDSSVYDLDSVHFSNEVPDTSLRRSSRKRCPRFSVAELLLSESSADDATVGNRSKKFRPQNSHGAQNGHTRRVAGRGGRIPKGGNIRSGLYTCSKCERSFTRSDNLKQHERLHRGDMYHCGDCGKEFSQSGHLKNHARLHTGERPYHCDDCGKSFRVSGSLRDHVRIHTGERPFACRTCGKSFTQAAHLRVHTRLHTGERRHVCDVCGKRFVRRTHLKLHKCTHGGQRRRRKKV